MDNDLTEKDPAFGVEKYLEVHLDLNEEECILTTSEGQPCKINFE